MPLNSWKNVKETSALYRLFCIYVLPCPLGKVTSHHVVSLCFSVSSHRIFLENFKIATCTSTQERSCCWAHTATAAAHFRHGMGSCYWGNGGRGSSSRVRQFQTFKVYFLWRGSRSYDGTRELLRLTKIRSHGSTAYEPSIPGLGKGGIQTSSEALLSIHVDEYEGVP